eukprot:1482061-Pleurochrysis_carterae.AAC.1
MSREQDSDSGVSSLGERPVRTAQAMRVRPASLIKIRNDRFRFAFLIKHRRRELLVEVKVLRALDHGSVLRFDGCIRARARTDARTHALPHAAC